MWTLRGLARALELPPDALPEGRGPDSLIPGVYVLEGGGLSPTRALSVRLVGLRPAGVWRRTDCGPVGLDTPELPCLRRSLVLNRLRPAVGAGKAQPSSSRWRNKGYRCIGGVLYKVSANKLSKTYGRPGDSGSRPLLRTGEGGPLTPRPGLSVMGGAVGGGG